MEGPVALGQAGQVRMRDLQFKWSKINGEAGLAKFPVPLQKPAPPPVTGVAW